MGINRWWRSSSTILDRTSLPLVQHRPTRRTDLPGAGLVQHAAELDTGEATSRSGYRRRSFPTLLVSAIQVQQHRLPVRWDRKPVNNEGSRIGISLIANALRSYVHLATDSGKHHVHLSTGDALCIVHGFRHLVSPILQGGIWGSIYIVHISIALGLRTLTSRFSASNTPALWQISALS